MFTGQERDGGTATLDYFNARHFSAVLGSLTQPDPMNAGGDIMNPQSWNAYAYVLGNPLGYTDPSGMSIVPCKEPDSIACVGNDPEPPSDPGNPGCVAYGSEGCIVSPGAPPVMPGGPGPGGSAGGGGGTTTAKGPAKNGPTIGPAPPAYTQLLPCIKQQYGLLATGGALTVAGQPIAGTKPFVTPGSSVGTSIASKASRTLLSGFKFSEPLPTPVGGLFTGRAFAMAATKDAGAFAGRWVPFLGEALLAYDALKIGSCAVNGLDTWKPRPAYIDTGVPW